MNVHEFLINKYINLKIIDSLIRTKNNNKEYGFNVCSTVKGIRVTGIEEGDEHHIHLEHRRCKKMLIGDFHTHISGEDAIPSASDILRMVIIKSPIICIGINKNDSGIVRCFDSKDLILEIEKIDKVSSRYTLPYLQLAYKLKSENDFLDNHSSKKIIDLNNETKIIIERQVGIGGK